jgi:hypothetical protein
MVSPTHAHLLGIGCIDHHEVYIVLGLYSVFYPLSSTYLPACTGNFLRQVQEAAAGRYSRYCDCGEDSTNTGRSGKSLKTSGPCVPLSGQLHSRSTRHLFFITYFLFLFSRYCHGRLSRYHGTGFTPKHLWGASAPRLGWLAG